MITNNITNKIENVKYLISQYNILKDIAKANIDYFLAQLNEANSYEKKVEIRAKREANTFWLATIQKEIISLQNTLIELMSEVEND
jgi:hypothetical protein